jgi:hypothetical protein
MKYYDFLVEYEKLCKKHKMFIDACGCCDSPFLGAFENIKIKENKLLFDFVRRNEDGEYISYARIDLKKLKEIIENMEDN